MNDSATVGLQLMILYKPDGVLLKYDHPNGSSRFSFELSVADARKMAMNLIRSCDKAESLASFRFDAPDSDSLRRAAGTRQT